MSTNLDNVREEPTAAPTPVQRTWRLEVTIPLILLAILLLAGAFIRLHKLDYMAYHHDESLHAYYAWKIYDQGLVATQRDPSHYDPVYHGPFLYQFGALYFFLFGDTDFTGRLPFVSVGILALFLAFLLFKDRDPVTWRTALIAVALLALSPSMSYFARFARNDVYISTWNLGMVVFALRYFQHMRKSDFMLMCLFTILSYATKENSYMSGAILCGFIVSLGGVRLITDWHSWRHRVFDDYSEFAKLLLLYGWFSVFMFLYAAMYEYAQPTHDTDTEGYAAFFRGEVGGVTALGSAIMGWFSGMMRAEGGAPNPLLGRATVIWWMLFFLCTVGTFIGLSMLRYLHASPGRDALVQKYRSYNLAVFWTLLLMGCCALMMRLAGVGIGTILITQVFLLLVTGGVCVANSVLTDAPGKPSRNADDMIVDGIVSGVVFVGAWALMLITLLPYNYEYQLASGYEAGVAPSWMYFMFWGMEFNRFTFALLLVLLAAWAVMHRRVGEHLSSWTGILRDNQLFIAGLLLILFLYSFLFTTIFVDRVGFGIGKNGIVDGALSYLTYWFKTQNQPRLLGPPTYWIWRILAYEPVLVFLCIWALFTVLLATVQNLFFWFLPEIKLLHNTDRQEQELQADREHFLPTFRSRDDNPILGWTWLPYVAGFVLTFLWCFILYRWALEPDKTIWKMLSYLPVVVFVLFFWQIVRERPMYAFLILWTVASIKIYSGLNEKAPWLICHQVLPMVLLGAMVFSDVFRHVQLRALRYAMLVPVVFGLAYAVHSTSLMNYHNPDDPREMLVYTQTDRKLLQVMHEIDQLAIDTSLNKELPIAVSGQANWPSTWYLRNYNQVRWSPPNDKTHPIVIVDDTRRRSMERQLGSDYYVREIPIRSWWQPEQTALRDDPSTLWQRLRAYLVHRKTWSNTGSQNIVVFRKYDPFDRVAAVERGALAERSAAPRAVREFGMSGSGPGQMNEPRGLTIRGQRIFVADSKNARIQVLDLQGQPIMTVPAQDETNPEAALTGEFTGPSDVAVDAAGNIYVADTWAPARSYGRVVKYDANGRFLKAWGSPEGIFGPRGIAVNSRGEVWLVDTGNKRVHIFDTEGNFKRITGGDGVLLGEFNEPVGIAFGPDDKAYIADTGNHRIQVFTAEGRPEYEILLPDTCWETTSLSGVEPAIAVSAKGSVIVTDSITNSIWVVQQFGRNVQHATRVGGAGQLQSPRGLALDDQGNIYVADSRNHRIVVWGGFDE